MAENCLLFVEAYEKLSNVFNNKFLLEGCCKNATVNPSFNLKFLLRKCSRKINPSQEYKEKKTRKIWVIYKLSVS